MHKHTLTHTYTLSSFNELENASGLPVTTYMHIFRACYARQEQWCMCTHSPDNCPAKVAWDGCTCADERKQRLMSTPSGPHSEGESKSKGEDEEGEDTTHFFILAAEGATAQDTEVPLDRGSSKHTLLS
jgi:hypothetical protein